MSSVQFSSRYPRISASEIFWNPNFWIFKDWIPARLQKNPAVSLKNICLKMFRLVVLVLLSCFFFLTSEAGLGLQRFVLNQQQPNLICNNQLPGQPLFGSSILQHYPLQYAGSYLGQLSEGEQQVYYNQEAAQSIVLNNLMSFKN